MSQLVVLDNEAVQALATTSHPKHRELLSQVQVVAARKARATSDPDDMRLVAGNRKINIVVV